MAPSENEFDTPGLVCLIQMMTKFIMTCMLTGNE